MVLEARRAARRGGAVVTAAAMTFGLSSLGVAPATAAHGTVDRAASGVSASGPVTLAPTPACEVTLEFGQCEREVAGVAVPGVLTTGVLQVNTVGTHDPLRADSTASVAEVVALPGVGELDPAALTANLVTSSCVADDQGLVGDTVIADIDILGVEPTETELTDPDPNFVVVDNDALFIILNEQITSDDGAQITVNAIRIVAFPGTELEQEVVISQSQCSYHAAAAPPPAGNGYLEICKKADNGNGAVTGRFTFRFAGRAVEVPVGTCSGPIRVPAGRLAVTEVRKDGIRMSGCATRPVARLLRCDPADRRAVVRIVEGGIAKETLLTITNKRIVVGDNEGAVKVCKIAGRGVEVGANFQFTVGGRSLSVPAGPADQGGYCKIARGFDRGSRVKVTEAARAGVHVSRIRVGPSGRKISASTAQRTATVRVGRGITVVSFTNARN